MIRNPLSLISTLSATQVRRLSPGTVAASNDGNDPEEKALRASASRARAAVAFALLAVAGALMAASEPAEAYWAPGPPVLLPGHSYLDRHTGNLVIVPGKWKPGQPVWIPDVIVRPQLR